MAWAVGELIDSAALAALLERYCGVIHEPQQGARGERMLACPVAGSLASLVRRSATGRARLTLHSSTARELA